MHLGCRENDLEIVLPAEPDDVDIGSGIDNVCFDFSIHYNFLYFSL